MNKSLPDMLRGRVPEIWGSNKQLPVSIGPELAALVEAADHMKMMRDDDDEARAAYDSARAALVAKIGGSK